MSTFALQLAAFAEKAGRNADLVIKKVSIDMLSKVVTRSPVDTGRFRGNWVLSVGSPEISQKDVTDKSGTSTISRESSKLGTFKIGPSVYIMNSLPYAMRLENGYSKQAPGGMVKVTVTEFQSLVDQAAKEVAP